MARVAQLQCVICVRFQATGLPTEVHHIAEGTSPQNNWLVAPLCGNKIDGGHHRGEAGLHGMGVRAFVRFYKVPQDSEYGLLAWVAEDLQMLARVRGIAA